jgi:hypothetical protein
MLLLLSAAQSAQAEPGLLACGVRALADRASREVVIFGLDPAALERASRHASAAAWQSLCKISVSPAAGVPSGESVLLLGTYQAQGSTLRFRCRYPLDQPAYHIVIDTSALGEEKRRQRGIAGLTGPLVIDVELASPARTRRPTTVVSAVYPSARILPENLLRLYLHFSAPMSRGEAYKHIHLVNSKGQPVEGAFLELDEELWSGDGKRFTLLFDPGRIKRGLRPREELGPALRQGMSYALVVDRDWSDAAGRPLAAGYRGTFQVGPPDQTPPDPRGWSIRPPASGTKEPLEVRFPKPLDDALARRLIAVKGEGGNEVAGRVELHGAETRWLFEPLAPWKEGNYRLEVGKELEDPCGNAVGRPFEVDAQGPITRRITPQSVVLPFRIISPIR